MKWRKEMKRLSLKLTSIVFVLSIAFIGLTSNAAQNSNKSATAERTIEGYISDNHCGLHHMKSMGGDDKACTLMCVKNGGKFVLADRGHKRVYQLDKTGQEKARDFAGMKVKVTGRLSGRTIRVTAIEAAS